MVVSLHHLVKPAAVVQTWTNVCLHLKPGGVPCLRLCCHHCQFPPQCKWHPNLCERQYADEVDNRGVADVCERQYADEVDNRGVADLCEIQYTDEVDNKGVAYLCKRRHTDDGADGGGD